MRVSSLSCVGSGLEEGGVRVAALGWDLLPPSLPGDEVTHFLFTCFSALVAVPVQSLSGVV